MTRDHWVALENLNALSQKELKELLKTAHQLVRDKLPKKVREELAKTK